MRDVIRQGIKDQPASNFGHAYDLLAPPPLEPGKPDVVERDKWIDRCLQVPEPQDYVSFYQRWSGSFAGAETYEATAKTRLLVGHGSPSGSDVGLTVHRPWGVPVLPGSALKGLVAHYVDAVYGAAEPDRRQWRGPTWTDRRIAQGNGAGAYFAALFGAPAVDGEDDSARRGFVEFHDALYVPDSVLGGPFARDVLTVHQKAYYDSSGKKGWPNDWDSPNPVSFITVRPYAKFLVVVTGEGDWPARAMALLRDALRTWGVGGKTAAGYGRLE